MDDTQAPVAEKFPAPLLPEESGEQVTARLLGYMAGSATVNMIYLADSLGLFAYLAERPDPESSSEVAANMGLAERWVRELLHQLASSRMISTNKDASLFWLTPVQAATLAHEEGPKASPFWMVGSCISLTEGAKHLHKLKSCFRTGVGMKYDDYGEDMGCGICRELSVWTRHHLLSHVHKIAGLHERLRAGATVADVGCGYGLAIELLAQAYPNSTFHGFDISTVALAAAQERTSTLQNVMLFNPEDEDEQPATKAYDFVLTLDAIHDMAAPEPVLATVRGSLKDDAIGYLVVDFHSKGDTARNITEMGEMAILGYSYSIMLCMSSALSTPNGRGLGTLGWHPQLAHRMLKDAGFSDVKTLEWESDLNSFYLAKP